MTRSERRGPLQRGPHALVRDPVAPGRPRDGRREDGGDDPALAVDERATGVARPDPAAEGRHRALDRAAAERVRRHDGPRVPEPAGADGVGPVEREAEDRRRRAGAAGRPRSAGAARRARRRAGSPGRRAGRKAMTRASRSRRLTPELHDRVVLPGHDVRVGDHRPRPRDPARPLHAQPARGPEHAHDGVAGIADLRVARDRRARRRDVGRRPLERREGVEARERVEQRSRRGQELVELAEDERALDVARGGCARPASAAPPRRPPTRSRVRARR